jgi:hypothetical protein
LKTKAINWKERFQYDMCNSSDRKRYETIEIGTNSGYDDARRVNFKFNEAQNYVLPGYKAIVDRFNSALLKSVPKWYQRIDIDRDVKAVKNEIKMIQNESIEYKNLKFTARGVDCRFSTASQFRGQIVVEIGFDKQYHSSKWFF